MTEWFNDKFERERLTKYTKRNLRKKNVFAGFFKKLSITNLLIIINVVIFIIISLISMILGEEIVRSFVAIQGNNFFNGYIWTPLTSMFMHANLVHLFVNMFSLFFLGNFVEKIIGRKRYLIFYLISGIFAGIFFAILAYGFGGVCIVNLFSGCLGEKLFSNPLTFAVGASGAIFALAGLLALLTPKNKVYLIVGPLIAIILMTILSGLLGDNPGLGALSLLINIYIIFSIFALFSPRLRRYAIPLEMPFWVLPVIAIVPLVIIGLFIDLPIGNTAHLGGLIVGLIYAMYLKKKYKKKTEMISRMFSK
ncbi:rhomboid family intramembrane serine protease [Candidatus Pacearchaeota archaeon]|nr:rhomboid family intramembrane serine protease [Candidatus Pacearchaeota archaeon]